MWRDGGGGQELGNKGGSKSEEKEKERLGNGINRKIFCNIK